MCAEGTTASEDARGGSGGDVAVSPAANADMVECGIPAHSWAAGHTVACRSEWDRAARTRVVWLWIAALSPIAFTTVGRLCRVVGGVDPDDTNT